MSCVHRALGMPKFLIVVGATGHKTWREIRCAGASSVWHLHWRQSRRSQFKAMRPCLVMHAQQSSNPLWSPLNTGVGAHATGGGGDPIGTRGHGYVDHTTVESLRASPWVP